MKITLERSQIVIIKIQQPNFKVVDYELIQIITQIEDSHSAILALLRICSSKTQHTATHTHIHQKIYKIDKNTPTLIHFRFENVHSCVVDSDNKDKPLLKIKFFL